MSASIPVAAAGGSGDDMATPPDASPPACATGDGTGGAESVAVIADAPSSGKSIDGDNSSLRKWMRPLLRSTRTASRHSAAVRPAAARNVATVHPAAGGAARSAVTTAATLLC